MVSRIDSLDALAAPGRARNPRVTGGCADAGTAYASRLRMVRSRLQSQRQPNRFGKRITE